MEENSIEYGKCLHISKFILCKIRQTSSLDNRLVKCRIGLKIDKQKTKKYFQFCTTLVTVGLELNIKELCTLSSSEAESLLKGIAKL